MEKEIKKFDAQDKEILRDLKEAIDMVEKSAKSLDLVEIKKSIQSRMKEIEKNSGK